MKTLFYQLLLLSTISLAIGCGKDAPEGPMLPNFDPTKNFTEINGNKSMEEWVEQGLDQEYKNRYHSFFCLCNASDHLIALQIAWRGYEQVSCLINPGEKYTNYLWSEFNEYYPNSEMIQEQGRLFSLIDIEWLNTYYDQEKYYQGPGQIYEIHTDFTQHHTGANPGDERQWYYEQFTDQRCRWTYIFTNADCERAKKVSEERDKQS